MTESGLSSKFALIGASVVSIAAIAGAAYYLSSEDDPIIKEVQKLGSPTLQSDPLIGQQVLEFRYLRSLQKLLTSKFDAIK